MSGFFFDQQRDRETERERIAAIARAEPDPADTKDRRHKLNPGPPQVC